MSTTTESRKSRIVQWCPTRSLRDAKPRFFSPVMAGLLFFQSLSSVPTLWRLSPLRPKQSASCPSPSCSIPPHSFHPSFGTAAESESIPSATNDREMGTRGLLEASLTKLLSDNNISPPHCFKLRGDRLRCRQALVREGLERG